MSAYQMTYDQTNYQTVVRQSDAIATAKAFVKAMPLYNTLSLMLGEPVIVGAYKNGGPVMYSKTSVDMMTQNTGDYIDADEYTSYSIVFPYVINGKEVYYQYGSRMGISVEITAK
jgi:hypothetical protein